MWIKNFADGQIISEDRVRRITWLSTPLKGLVQVTLQVVFPDGSKHSISLSGYSQYWHSRTSECFPQNGERKETAERIQGLREDGNWDTIEFTGTQFRRFISPKAIGKPVWQ